METIANQTTGFLQFSKIIRSLKLYQPVQFKSPDLVLGVLNPDELVPIIFNHCLIQRLILDRKFDLIKVYLDKLFEPYEDMTQMEKLLSDYSHPKLFDEGDKNKLLGRVKRRVERNYPIIRDNFQEYIYIIVENFHAKDKFTNKLFYIDFTQNPDLFKENLLKIPNEQFFDKLLEIMCELFSLQFVWHRLNLRKRCFETWKFKRNNQARSTCEFAEIDGRFYLFMSKKFSAQGVNCEKESEYNIKQASWVSEEHKSVLRVDSVAQKVRGQYYNLNQSENPGMEGGSTKLNESLVTIDRKLTEKEQKDADRFYEIKTEIKSLKEELLIPIFAKIETQANFLENSSELAQLQEKNQILQLQNKDQNSKIQELKKNLKKNEQRLEEKNQEIKSLNNKLNGLNNELQNARFMEEEKDEKTQDFQEEKAELMQKYSIVSRSFVQAMVNIIKINQGKATSKILGQQVQKLKKIKDDQVIDLLVKKMFPLVMKGLGSQKKSVGPAESDSESDSDDQSFQKKPAGRLFVKKSFAKH